MAKLWHWEVINAEAVLIVELEDLKDGIEEDASQVQALLETCNATEVRRAKNRDEQDRIWEARKGAFGAIGQISPSYYTQDGVIPRSKLPEVMESMAKLSKKYQLTIANVFHAGDGNLHPLILYDSQNREEVKKTFKLGKEILQLCISSGGTLSGEHGIGLEKADLMEHLFSQVDLDNMQWVRAFFNPDNLLNPGKIFPTPGRCSEIKVVRTRSGVTP